MALASTIGGLAAALIAQAPALDGVNPFAFAEQLTPRPAAVVAGLDASSRSGTFPIAGKHDLGRTATNGFGGPRNHQGQDMFAACGTPLVAVRDAKVQHVAYEGAAGNYLVLRDRAGRSYVYMHLRSVPLVKEGRRVKAGQRVGFVGRTGDAEGCHLHFERWTAPGWYTGGHAVDPLPQLRGWDRAQRR